MQVSIVYALITAALWAIPPIAQKALIRASNPEAVLVTGALLYSLAALAFAIVNWRRVRVGSVLFKNSSLLLLGVFSVVVGAFLGNVLFLKALRDHASHIVIALAYTSPVFVLAWTMLMNGGMQRVTWKSVVGVMAVVAGVILVILEDTKGQM